MANTTTDPSVYYVPHNGWYPVWVAAALFCMVFGFGGWLNETKAGGGGVPLLAIFGLALLCAVLYFWFAKVIEENSVGLGQCAAAALLRLGHGLVHLL